MPMLKYPYLLATIAMATLAGCGQEKIQHYSIDKELPAVAPESGGSHGGGSPSDGGGMSGNVGGNVGGASSVPSETQGTELSYEAPESWQEAPSTGISSASFVVADGAKKVDVTVTPLSVRAGAVGPNINRWRRMIGLPQLTDEQIQETAKKMTVGGEEGTYVQLYSPSEEAAERATLGVIVVAAGKSWFFKMNGDASVAKLERERFEAFVASAKFE